MTTTFSAGPQAIGYLHQVRYALYALLRESRDDVAVIVEGLDDIEIQTAQGPIRLDQLKHHIKGTATLTNASSDLWKTIRIWASQMRCRAWDPAVTKLNLVTTAMASRDTAAWYLKNGTERDVNKARNILLQTIESSRTTESVILQAFSELQSLSEREQTTLFHAITIIDCAITITELPTLIKQQIKLAAPPSERLLDLTYRQLEGWWFAKVVDQLIGESKEPITLMALRRVLWSITEQIHEDNLPIEYANAVPDTIIDPSTDERMFVQQLKYLDIHKERVKRAILDYYRAFEQRSSWSRQHLLIDHELTQYEQQLIDEWEALRLALEDEMPIAQEEQYIQIGRQILKWVEIEANIKIRPNVDNRFILRGSFHMLADADHPRVYWHPKFLERLEGLLTP